MSIPASYFTIEKPVKGNYREKGSKFLAFGYPVKSEDEIKKSLESLQKEFFDARHHCFAWILEPDKSRFRAFDDGEPNHSAGDPILGQIRSRELTNVLVVVVRYFGGVKLGVGGLINAYRTAASDALQKAVIIEEDVVASFDLKYSYDAVPEVMKLVKEFNLQIVQQEYNATGAMKVNVKLKNKDGFLEKVKLLKRLKVGIELT